LWPAAFLATVRWPARENVAPPRPHPLRDRQLWSACGIGAVALTLLLRLPWALDDLHRQAAATSSALAQRERDWPNTLAGHVGLFFDGLDRWGYVLSVPLALLSAAGLVLLIRRRELRAVGLLFALSALSYYGLFIAMIRFQPERYYLPLALMGAVAAGYALSRVSVRGRGGRAAAAGAVAVVLDWAADRA